ncbi:hypothetical protein Tco_0294706 [Tanacetum coccineum]
MSGTVPPIPSPLGTSFGNTGNPNVNKVDTMRTTSDPINTMTRTNNDLILAHEGPYDRRDTKIVALRLKFSTFKSLEGEKVNRTFTRLTCLLNDLQNNGVSIPQAEVNATFVNNLPRKWQSMNQTHRANNSIKNDCLATLYGKYNYEEGLIDQIYEPETQRFNIQASSSKSLISNNHFQDSDLDIKEDQRTNNEFMADLNVEYHERALLANQKRFYKRSKRVRSARKPIDKSKETCFACKKPILLVGNLVIFKKNALQTKPLHHLIYPQMIPSTNLNLTHHPSTKHLPRILLVIKRITRENTRDLAKMVVLTKRIDDLTKGNNEKGKNTKGKSEKGLIAESFDYHEESVSSEDKGTTKIRALMAIAKDEPSVRKADARSSQWVDITMKKTCSKVIIDQLLSEQIPGNIVKALGGRADYSIEQLVLTLMEEEYLKRYSKKSGPKVVFGNNSSGDTEGYDSFNYNGITFTMVAYVNGLKHNLINISQLCDANFKVLFKKTQGTIFNLNDEVVLIAPRKRDVYIIDILCYNKESNASDKFSSMSIPEVTSDSESECETQEPLPPLPKLIRAAPVGTSHSLISLADLTLNMVDLTLNTSIPKKTNLTSINMSSAYVIKKKTENKSPAVFKFCSDKKADSSTKQLLLTLMEEEKGLKKQIEIHSGTSPSIS